ncbi:hypothetical protein TNCV_2697231 [Trichonephila clavipes]|nr:hypothetical protein TNCV_2697231 [Trichonephila clavipes]
MEFLGYGTSSGRPVSVRIRTITGHSSRMVKVLDRGWPSYEFEPSITKDLPCRVAMHVKSVENSDVLPRCCGVVVQAFYRRTNAI